MNDSDKHAFVKYLTAAYDLHHKEMTPSAVRLWWACLKAYEIEDISRALSQLVQSSKFLPKPSQVVDIIDPPKWPTAAEAWALCLKDERETGAVCDAILGAWNVAEGLWQHGDRTGARRAFEGAWDRLVAERLARGERRPRWRLSLGWDTTRRMDGIRAAVDRGLLSADQVQGYLDAKAQAQRLLPPARQETRGGLRLVREFLDRTVGGGTGGAVPARAATPEGGETPTGKDAKRDEE